MKQQPLSLRSKVVVSKGQISAELSDEVAILHVGKGVYYGLNEVGTRVWKGIGEPRSVEEILEDLLSRYDVEPGQCRRDLFSLLEELIAEGLVDVKHEAAR